MHRRLAFTVLCLLAGLFLACHRALAAEPRIRILITGNDTARPESEGAETVSLHGTVDGEQFVNGRQYGGTVQVSRRGDQLAVVNEMPLEEYVADVVAAEMGKNWEPEALKAQAVMTRTYATKKVASDPAAPWHITSSVLHQAYKGSGLDPGAASAARATAGEILTWQGKPIEALFHSTSGGRTESSEEVFGEPLPYLRSVETNCEGSPYAAWERRILLGELGAELGFTGVRGLSVADRTDSGRVRHLAVATAQGEMTVEGKDLRRILGWSRLPSTLFDVAVEGDTAVFNGRGYGHGVGLCQYSALKMAREGRKYREILAYFFPGTEIRHWPQ